MFCDKCGAKLTPGATACPSCGKPSVPFMPPTRGIAGHIRLLGILWVAYGALHVVPALIVFVIAQRINFPQEVPIFMRDLVGIIAGFFIAGGTLAVVAGAGLLMRATWGRMTALVAAALALINVPLGTALGGYTMWALLPTANEEEYRTLTRVA
jgi:hypothetical protein